MFCRSLWFLFPNNSNLIEPYSPRLPIIRSYRTTQEATRLTSSTTSSTTSTCHHLRHLQTTLANAVLDKDMDGSFRKVLLWHKNVPAAKALVSIRDCSFAVQSSELDAPFFDEIAVKLDGKAQVPTQSIDTVVTDSFVCSH